MHRKKFELWHSLVATVAISAFEAILVAMAHDLAHIVAIVCASLGGAALIYVSTEVIREVRNPERMYLLLAAVIFEFIAFFAVQYWLVSVASPGSYPGLAIDPISLFLHSTMVFALNPLYIPTNSIARTLMLLNTVESLVLGLFVLQNIWQIRSEKST